MLLNVRRGNFTPKELLNGLNSSSKKVLKRIHIITKMYTGFSPHLLVLLFFSSRDHQTVRGKRTNELLLVVCTTITRVKCEYGTVDSIAVPGSRVQQNYI